MNSNLILFLTFFDIFLSTYANDQFHFGVINHRTKWYFHCPNNITRISDAPSNDQPLISYECPLPSYTIEILPIEIDFTFFCRLRSRLIWLIIDLYQYNILFSLINSNDIEIIIHLNNKIQINTSKSELNHFTNHSILINAFYIPFENIDHTLLNQQIEINVEIKNVNQTNQCEFTLKDNSLWKTFIDEKNCDSIRSNTLFIQDAKCHFYTTSKSIDTNIDDLNLELSIDQTDPTTENYSLTNYTNVTLPTNFIPYHHYLSFDETYRQIFASIPRPQTNVILLKLTFIFLVIILIILILFFVYMLYYHYRLQMRSSPLIAKSLVEI
ncbi:unnamed protein product [Adineta steineri]|uniref:Uncharacterized protein n=1 Tax=Adineta steineri TaxID=433720 RepID=A0A815XTP9_9BILA|nr:unnamed protein product [Adineta steineri]CAF1278622.1 unnamed protein product [Adineta steineri]CAF1561649.1 unnamed protein product [Adineta steineri]CAF1561805.1 unnamed protein product [Adineta steineri]